MSRLRRILSRPRSAAIALAAMLAILAPAQAGVVARRSSAAAPVPPAGAAAPQLERRSDLLALQPEPEPTRAARAERRSSPKPKVKPKPKPPTPDVRPFKGHGAWIDLWDYAALDIGDTITLLKRNHVRTIYLQTGRFNTKKTVDPAVGPWLEAGHRAGMDVVAWYLPGYSDMKLERRRSMAMATYRYRGHAFDAIGIDIEWKNDVPNPEWNERVVENLRQVRRALDDRIALAAIVPPPLQMDVAPRRWKGFPWKGIGAHSDVIMLMSYWSYRDCDDIPDHCAYPFTVLNLRETRRLTGNDRIPIHTIGGVGDRITRAEVKEFVRGARDGEAYGASMYDVRTTAAGFWPLLARLRTL